MILFSITKDSNKRNEAEHEKDQSDIDMKIFRQFVDNKCEQENVLVQT
jgi:hypothetical protein